MSKCDIAIRFRSDQRTFQPGDSIQGTVIVDVNKEVTCKKLLIEFLWMTHGKGNTDRGIVDSKTITEVSWVSGSSYTYEFSFTAPDYPLTYHGQILNIDYYIRARADIPWAIDPKGKEDLILVPGPLSKDAYIQAMEKEKKKMTQKTQSSTVGKIIGWILIPVILVLLIWMMTMLIPIIILIGIVVGIRKYMLYKANKLLGNVAVSLNEVEAVTPGQRIPVSVSFQPGKELKINKATVTLTGEEICVSGSGTNRTTHRHQLHIQELTLSDALEIYPGSYQEFRDTIVQPDLEAYTFKSSDNRTEWKIKVHIDIPRYPDWKNEYMVHLIPDNQPQR